MADYGSAKRSRGGISPTSRMTDADPSFLEMRNSLLHMTEESMGEKKTQTHRLISVSKYKSTTTNKEVGAKVASIAKNLENLHPEEVTGLLLVFPQHCVHILEGSTEIIVQYMREVRKEEADNDGLFIVSKNLAVAHNIQTVLFQNWMFNIFDIQATGIGDYETTEATDSLVIDMVVNILKIGLFLSKQPKLSYTSAVQALHERVPELLPQQDILEFFLEKPDPAVQEVTDFLKMYEEPFKVTMQGEIVWPMPDHMMPSFG